MLNIEGKKWNWLIAIVVEGWAVLDLSPVLVMKLELNYGLFASLHNPEISFYKIFVDLILRSPSLTRSPQHGPQPSILFSKCFIDLMLTYYRFLEYFLCFSNNLLIKSLPGTFIRRETPSQNVFCWSTF